MISNFKDILTVFLVILWDRKCTGFVIHNLFRCVVVVQDRHSKHYLMIAASGGLNQQRTGVSLLS
jgi:hypothetical protein